MTVKKETMDNIVEEYFKQPSRSLASIIFNEHAKDITLEESGKVYEVIQEKISRRTEASVL